MVKKVEPAELEAMAVEAEIARKPTLPDPTTEAEALEQIAMLEEKRDAHAVDRDAASVAHINDPNDEDARIRFEDASAAIAILGPAIDHVRRALPRLRDLDEQRAEAARAAAFAEAQATSSKVVDEEEDLHSTLAALMPTVVSMLQRAAVLHDERTRSLRPYVDAKRIEALTGYQFDPMPHELREAFRRSADIPSSARGEGTETWQTIVDTIPRSANRLRSAIQGLTR